MRTLALLAGTVLAMGLSGCNLSGECTGTHNCGPCPPDASVEVYDAVTTAAVADVTAVGGGGTWTCAPVGGRTLCSTAPSPGIPAAFDITVSAPGYASASVHVAPVTEASDCCPSCQVYPTLEVPLTAL